MTNGALLRIAGIGTVVTALCCFTPVLVIAFGALGFGGAVAYLDSVLLPLLVVFASVTAFALIKRFKGLG